MIKFDELQGMHLISWFPCVVAFKISFPFDKILELSGPAMMSVVDDALHFIFLLAVD